MFSRADATSPSTKPSVRSIVFDEEFGSISYRRSAQARYVRIRISEDGAVRASLPKRAPLRMIHELLNASRPEIRKLVNEQKAKLIQYQSGMKIGHSHRLVIEYVAVEQPTKQLRGQELAIQLPESYRLNPEAGRAYVSEHVKKALRREATAYLPRRLRYLADMYGFTYERERFGNQSGRWGSCSSSGTISLNVALMNLPLELIDYVLIHELSHTKQMNHSPDFWDEVERCMPDYRIHKKKLKSMSPIC